MGSLILVVIVLFASDSFLTSAYDPSPLQDFCVAVDDPKNALFVNGKFCKDPKLVKAEDFFLKDFNIPGNTSGNPFGIAFTQTTTDQLPGLNTLGISFLRADIAPKGVVPPHTHPRATEIVLVLEGTLNAGFVTSDPNYTLFSKILHKGDVFVFPIGLIHFLFNVGKTNAEIIVGFSSQNPGAIFIGDALFGSEPFISDDVLTKSLKIDKKVVDYLKAQFKKSS